MIETFPYLNYLVPKTDLSAWYSLDNDIQSGEDVNTVTGDGSGFDLLTGAGSKPIWKVNRFGEKHIYFDGNNVPLRAVIGSGKLYKHIFVIASYEDALFHATNNPGLLTSDTVDIFVGKTGATEFFDFVVANTTYIKSGISYPSSAFPAPMNGVPELLEHTFTNGYSLTEIQFGQQKGLTSRRWKGTFHGALFYTKIQTGENLEKIRLYANLKSQLWRQTNQTLMFPSPGLIKPGFDTYNRFENMPEDFSDVDVSNEYADGGKSFYEIGHRGTFGFEIEFKNLSIQQRQVLDAFAANVRTSRSFDFYDYRFDKTYTGMKIKSYRPSHPAHQSFKNSARFEIVKYPNS